MTSSLNLRSGVYNGRAAAGKSARLLGFLLLFVTAGGGPAETRDRWVSHGPYGGTTAVLLPSVEPGGGLYAGVPGYGVYKVAAGSSVWDVRAQGLDDLLVEALVQDPTSPNTLYAGTRSGVYRTTDDGLNWELRSGGLGVSYAEALAIDPVHPQIVYSGAIWQGDWAVYKTTNAGETWGPTGPGIPVGLQITCLLVDPLDTDVVYAGTEDPNNYVPDEAGVYKSVDGGATWVPSGNGLLNTHVRTLTFDPSSSQTLYAGMYGNWYVPDGGVYVSRDGGADWDPISNGLPIDQELSINSIAVVPVDGRARATLYAAGSYGVSLPQPPGTWEPRLYRSTNGGATWQEATTGIAYPDVLSVAVDPADPGVVYAGTDCGGVFRSTDAGDHWSHWSDGLAPLRVSSLGIHPHDENIVYAGVRSFLNEATPQDAGVYVTFDGGLNWEPRPSDMRVGDSFHVASVAVAPCEPDHEAILAANAGWMLYKSIDEGVTWEWRGGSHGIGGYWLQEVVVDPTDPYVAYVSGAGFEPSLPDVYKTTDCGESWTAVASYLVWMEFVGLAIDPTDTQVVYVGSAWEGVYKTTNGGASWNPTGPEVDGAKAKSIIVDPRNPQHVYVGDNQWQGTGVYVSYDGGDRWQLFSDGLFNLDVEALAIDSVPTGTEYPVMLYAGTEGGGVFSRDQVGWWREMNEGLTDLRVYALALGPAVAERQGADRALYAGTAAGAYRWARSGDFDGDGDVDDFDLDAFTSCYTGPGDSLVAPGCEAGDFDGDGDIDCDDWASFKEVWSLGGLPTFSGCPDGCCHSVYGTGRSDICTAIVWTEECEDGWVVNACLDDGGGNGIDDACEPITGLTLAREGAGPDPSTTSLQWTAHPAASTSDIRYDIVRGDLEALLVVGDFTPSVDQCTADDHADVTLEVVGDDPSPGSGQWFLVRGVWVTPELVSYAMTYDTIVPDLPEGSGQTASRDLAIDGSPLACP